MSLTIRQADLESDRKILIDKLSQYLTPLSNDTRFDWLYLSNPFGRAKVWVAVDSADDAVVGVSSAFPRLVYTLQGEQLVWVLGDFCIDPRYRSLGPALQLQRACLDMVDSETMQLMYDFPSISMLAVFKRLHILPSGQMIRFAKPLRIDRKIKQHVRLGWAAAVLSTLGNLCLPLFDRAPVGPHGVRVSVYGGDFDKEFTGLAEQIGNRYGVCIKRSAEYLQWRYRMNPLNRYEVWTATREGALLAYTILTQHGEDATIVDLFGINDTSVLSKLVFEVVAELRRRGVVTVSVPVIEGHPWTAILKRQDFRPRDANPVIVYAGASSPLKIHTRTSAGWFLMQGDRDS